MRRRLRDAIQAGSLALMGGLSCESPVLAAPPPISAAPGVRGPEIMLYVSQPLGPSSSRRTFGLRIDQHSLPALLPAPTTNPSDLSGRRELLNLHVAAHESPRLDFGRRLSWDFATRRLGSPTASAPLRLRAGGTFAAQSDRLSAYAAP